MKYPTPYFKNVPQIGNLYLDYIFIEVECPILFTCKDENKKLYLCDCIDIVKEQEWIIVPTTKEKIVKLIKGEITLYNIFKIADGVGCKAYWNREEGQRYHLVKSSELEDNELPDEFLEFEEDEINEYLDYMIFNLLENCIGDEFNENIQSYFELNKDIYQHYNKKLFENYKPQYDMSLLEKNKLIESKKVLLQNAIKQDDFLTNDMQQNELIAA